jgi:menaquinone-dependent protoporphyrinogen oxidase
MSDILVVYGTIEGQARKIALFVADRLARRCDVVRIVDAAHTPTELDFRDFDAAILVATTRPERLQSGAAAFARAHAGELARMPTALVSVSLQAYGGDAEDEEDARQYVEELCAETGWRPRRVHYAAGALHFARYDPLQRLTEMSAAKEIGLDARAGEDLELTDWRALASFVDDFARTEASGRQQAPCAEP